MTHFTTDFVENFKKARVLLNEYYDIESTKFEPYQTHEQWEEVMNESIDEMNELHKDENLTFHIDTRDNVCHLHPEDRRKLMIKENDFVFTINFSQL